MTNEDGTVTAEKGGHGGRDAGGNGGGSRGGARTRSADTSVDGPRSGSSGGEATPFLTFLFVLGLLLAFALMVALLLLNFPAGGDERRWLVLVMVAGALGSFVHVASSAGDYIGERRLVGSWIYWYALRLPVGSSLALLLYLILRGGVLTGVPLPSPDQPYGIIGLSALAGMFAKKASNKLSQVFETIFNTSEDARLGDKIDGAAPVLLGIVGNPPALGDPPGPVTFQGKNFTASSLVRINDEARETEFLSATRLRTVLRPEDLAKEQDLEVVVETPGIEEGVSETFILKIAPRSE